MSLERTYVWRKLRERKILRQHARVAAICEDLIARYRAEGPVVELKAKKELGTDRIIWQYWAQGYDEVPPVVVLLRRAPRNGAGKRQSLVRGNRNVDDAGVGRVDLFHGGKRFDVGGNKDGRRQSPL